MKAARKRLGVLPRSVRGAQVGPKLGPIHALVAGVVPRPAGDHEGYSAQANLPGGRERPVSTAIVWNELEHHMVPVVRYTQIGGSAAGPTAVAGSAFTFGEGTLVTCWHCVKQPLGPDEFYGSPSAEGASSHRMSSARSTTSKGTTTVLTSLWVTLIGCLVVA
jgi:hypothetical protein